MVVLVPDELGRLSQVNHFRPYVAGAEVNTAIGLARLGIACSFASGVGNDPFGEKVLRAAREEGVDVAHVQLIDGAQTGVFFKQWSGLQHATSVFYYRSGSAMAVGRWDTGPLEKDLADGAWDWVHVTGITAMISPPAQEAFFRVLKAAKQSGSTVSLDINVRLKLASLSEWKSLAQRVLPYVDWFFTGDEEAMQLFDTKDSKQLEQIFRGQGFEGEGVVVKEGADGAVACVGGVVTRVPAFEVRSVVDTVGAGDGFNAGFIAGMLRDMPFQEALRLGCLVGAYAVTSAGDYAGYPTLPEVAAVWQGKEEAPR